MLSVLHEKLPTGNTILPEAHQCGIVEEGFPGQRSGFASVQFSVFSEDIETSLRCLNDLAEH
jgi:hypothetical protein